MPAGEAQAFAFGKGGALYTAYQARLATLNAVDFGDLLLLCLKLWRENPDVLVNYQDRFRYILVDEYQDTNVAQYLWLRLLAQSRKNIAWEVVLEAQDVVDLGAAPAVDRLVVVAHAGDVLPGLREQAQKNIEIGRAHV